MCLDVGILSLLAKIYQLVRHSVFFIFGHDRKIGQHHIENGIMDDTKLELPPAGIGTGHGSDAARRILLYVCGES